MTGRDTETKEPPVGEQETGGIAGDPSGGAAGINEVRAAEARSDPSEPNDEVASGEAPGDLARLADTSDTLLAEVRALRRAEEMKRALPIASAEFHELANEVELRANRIWRIASAERIEGERIERQTRPADDEGIESAAEDSAGAGAGSTGGPHGSDPVGW